MMYILTQEELDKTSESKDQFNKDVQAECKKRMDEFKEELNKLFLQYNIRTSDIRYMPEVQQMLQIVSDAMKKCVSKAPSQT